MKSNNFVKKFMELFNKPSTEVDRKKRKKKGYVKHKNSREDESNEQ